MGTKSFDNYADLITFSRASGGTALRKISYGPELVTNGTFDTDSDWTKVDFTISGGQASTSSGTAGYIDQSISFVSGKVYEISVDVVSISGGSGSIQARGVSTAASTIGADAGGTTHKFIYADTSNNTTLRVYAGSSTNLTIDNISIKEVLFDQPDGTLTLFNHLNNIPRIEYDADGNRLGLLIEEQRTNLLTDSNTFTAATGTATQNEIGLDGLTSAWTLENPGGNAARVDHAVTVSTSTTYTYSVYAKQGTTNFFYLSAVLFTTPANGSVWFDLSSGTVGVENTGLTGSITAYNDGWYRCSITFTTDVSDTSGVLRINVSKGDGQTTADIGDNILLYGAQLEQGSFPTSYIPTSGSTATRAADVASIPVSDFGYNQSEGTIFVEADAIGTQATTAYFSDGTANERFFLYVNDGYQGFVGDGGSTQAQLDGGTTVAGFDKTAMGIKEDNTALSFNGGSSVSDTSCTVPTVTKMNIGSIYNNTVPFSMHIKSIKYYPRRLTNDQLQELTA